MINLRKRLTDARNKAKELMENGKLNDYIEMLSEIEQMELLLNFPVAKK
ncbi:MAG: hypothetical protein IH946_08510 [Bacteroidetes bacterium]|nr:hypothetical protein [Bacteroidota bacterium]